MKVLLFFLFLSVLSHGDHHHHHHDHHEHHEDYNIQTRYFLALGSSFFISLLSLIGVGCLNLKNPNVILLISSMAVGSMLADTFFHLVPEIFSSGKSNGWMILAGFMICLVIEMWITSKKEKTEVKAFGYINLFTDAIHNFLDGIGIAGAFMSSSRTGFATSIAMIFHEIPQEFSDFVILLSSGFTLTFAIWSNLVCGLFSVIGCLFGIYFGSKLNLSSHHMMSWSAGSFIYISCVNLLPEILSKVCNNITHF